MFIKYWLHLKPFWRILPMSISFCFCSVFVFCRDFSFIYKISPRAANWLEPALVLGLKSLSCAGRHIETNWRGARTKKFHALRAHIMLGPRALAPLLWLHPRGNTVRTLWRISTTRPRSVWLGLVRTGSLYGTFPLQFRNWGSIYSNAV